MQAERLTNFKVFVGDKEIGTADIKLLPTLEQFEAPPIQGVLEKHITGTVDCVFDQRAFYKLMGAGYYAKTKGKQPRTVFVIKRGWQCQLQ